MKTVLLIITLCLTTFSCVHRKPFVCGTVIPTPFIYSVSIPSDSLVKSSISLTVHYIKNISNKPLDDASVALLSSNDSLIHFTDINGKCCFDNVDTGNYSLLIKKDSFQTLKITEIDIDQPKVVTINTSLNKY